MQHRGLLDRVRQHAVEVHEGDLTGAVDLVEVALDHDGAPAAEVVDGVVDGVGARAGVDGGVAARAAPAGGDGGKRVWTWCLDSCCSGSIQVVGMTGTPQEAMRWR